MSKLDDILQGHTMVHTDNEAKQQIKSLMLELIGEDMSEQTVNPAWGRGRNQLRAELRKKVEEL